MGQQGHLSGLGCGCRVGKRKPEQKRLVSLHVAQLFTSEDLQGVTAAASTPWPKSLTTSLWETLSSALNKENSVACFLNKCFISPEI